jgi:hypothetical protein
VYGILVTSENRVLRKINGNMREKVAEENCIMGNGELFILSKCYYGHQINKDEMEVACGTPGKVEN